MLDLQTEIYRSRLGDNPIEINVRDGFPHQGLRDIADVIHRFLSMRRGSWPDEPRNPPVLCSIFHDDTHGNILSIEIGTTEADSDMAGNIESVLSALFDFTFYIDVQLFPKGRETSDHYHHEAYILSQRRSVSHENRD